MKISYKWLQNYFDEKLPAPEKLAELITFGFAEVESVEKVGGDTVLDIKVLPDRACYALSHRGVAYEVSAITGLPKKEMNWPQPKVAAVRPLSVKVEAPELCPRYMARVVEGITQKEMPWVKEYLEAIGQRSINPVVDGTNLVMFDMGQPLHAFDADKVEGGIVVRRARKGEKITTLDNREVALDESVLVIADERSPLAVAGIKGGKKAEVTADTKNLILESANFDPSYIRQTAERLGIRTEASKRFENRLPPGLTRVGIDDFTAFLFEMDKNFSAGEVTDIYSNVPRNIGIDITAEYLSEKIGLKASEAEIDKLLKRLEIIVEKKGKRLVLTPPHFRLDLAIPEDIAEEIGRLIGYDKIPAALPPKPKGGVEIPKSFYYEWKIREILVEAGFSEVMTSSFGEQGTVEIEKPLAEDKKFARANLHDGFVAALKMNVLNAPLFGADEARIFEIGRVFAVRGEHAALALGVAGPKKKIADALSEAVRLLSDKLGVSLSGDIKDGIFECGLDSVFEKLPEPKSWGISIPAGQTEKYQPFSPYPFIVRDIALFVSPDTPPKEVEEIIKKQAGNLVIRGPELFDEFSTGGKKSLAFRLLFQSSERTLTDGEVNASMERVYTALKTNGWKVR